MLNFEKVIKSITKSEIKILKGEVQVNDVNSEAIGAAVNKENLMEREE